MVEFAVNDKICTAELPGETLVIIDDHESFAELLAGALSAIAGVKCVGMAASAAEGVTLTADLRPDIVIIDVQLPDFSGLAAIQEIRRHSPETLVVASSAHRDPIWGDRAAHAGATSYVVKGGPLTELVAALSRIPRTGEAPGAQPQVCAAKSSSNQRRAVGSAVAPNGFARTFRDSLKSLFGMVEHV